MSCDREFEDPVELGGRVITTLRQAGEYVQSLPATRRRATEWQTAIEALLLTVEHNGPTMHARMGFMAALQKDQSKPPAGTKQSRQSARWSAARAAR